MCIGTALSDKASAAVAPVGGQFPFRVLNRLAGYRQWMLADAEGDILDLNLNGSVSEIESTVRRSGSLDTENHDVRRYDLVIGVAALVGVADISRFLADVTSLLRPDGRLWLIEPAYRPGLGAAVATTLWSYHPAVRGLHVGRNMATAVRNTGFTITDIERLTMPTTVRPLQTFLSIRAERFDR